MTVKRQNFEMQEGDSVIIETTVENDDGTMRDITEHSATFVLSKYEGDGEILRRTESDSEVNFYDPTNGGIEVKLHPEDTEDEWGTLYYEIELSDGTGNDHTVTVGEITIHQSF